MFVKKFLNNKADNFFSFLRFFGNFFAPQILDIWMQEAKRTAILVITNGVTA